MQIYKPLNFSSEWKTIPFTPDIPNYFTSIKESNLNKNRYNNILTLESTRVILNNSDYINANWINLDDTHKIIATQAPLPNTCTDFWNMILENDIEYIVMLTNFIEKNEKKADVYFPEYQGNTITFNDITISNIFTSSDTHISTRHFLIYNKYKSLYTIHLHYISWPDFGIPSDSSELINLIKYIYNKKVVIHCSAGCGRTGVICAILRYIYTKEPINNIISYLRNSRYGMVQTKDQYKFIYETVDNPKLLEISNKF
jgi:protein tyrosine phosphatase